MGILRLTKETCEEIIGKEWDCQYAYYDEDYDKTEKYFEDNFGNDEEKIIRECIEEYDINELYYRTGLTEDDIKWWADAKEYEIELYSEIDKYVVNFYELCKWELEYILSELMNSDNAMLNEISEWCHCDEPQYSDDYFSLEDIKDNELIHSLHYFTTFDVVSATNSEQYREEVIKLYDLSIGLSNDIVSFCEEINKGLEYYVCELEICTDENKNNYYFHKEVGIHIRLLEWFDW